MHFRLTVANSRFVDPEIPEFVTPDINRQQAVYLAIEDAQKLLSDEHYPITVLIENGRYNVLAERNVDSRFEYPSDLGFLFQDVEETRRVEFWAQRGVLHELPTFLCAVNIREA